MIHYSCDMCKCELDPTHETTYVVRMEVYPAPVEADAAIDNDRDHLEDIHEVLERFRRIRRRRPLARGRHISNPPLRAVQRMLQAVFETAAGPQRSTAVRLQQALKVKSVDGLETLGLS